MFTYECFYKNKRVTVQAFSSFDAQKIAAEKFKARKAYEVTVVLAAKPSGTPVIHDGAEL